jgi:uncharacterized protein YndB with AHSA1/START domain
VAEDPLQRDSSHAVHRADARSGDKEDPMKVLLVVVAVLAGLVALAAIIGAFRPKTHTVVHEVILAASPDRVWAEVATVERQPEWVPEITKVERLPDREGQPSYREHFGGFAATTVVTVSEPPRRLVKEILPEGPFYGSWTWDLEPDGERTRLTITEQGTVPNPLFRAMMIFHDNTKSARDYADALARRLGVAIEVAP